MFSFFFNDLLLELRKICAIFLAMVFVGVFGLVWSKLFKRCVIFFTSLIFIFSMNVVFLFHPTLHCFCYYLFCYLGFCYLEVYNSISWTVIGLFKVWSGSAKFIIGSFSVSSEEFCSLKKSYNSFRLGVSCLGFFLRLFRKRQ